DDPAGYIGLGVVRALAGDLHGAVSDLEHALSIESDNAVALYDPALAEYALAHFDKAAERGQQAASKDPYYAAAFNNLAAALVQLGRDADAEQALGNALSK